MAATCGIYEALWLARLHQASAGALYVHIPFCVRKCAYCDFASWACRVGDPLINTYLERIADLFAQAVDAGLLERCTTAFIGGGTPSLAGPALSGLVATVAGRLQSLEELTCEANPESCDRALIAALREAGCTRLSVGVQSLHDDELVALGRVHDAARARDCLQAACASGMQVSCDLMCATPLQTDRSWHATVVAALACGVGHVSVYPLQIEEGTPFERRYGETPAWNDPAIQARRMSLAEELLVEAGLARYEVASYARPGAACRHNQAYWTAVPYLGLGTQASSMLTREGYERLRTVCPHLPVADEDIRRVRLTCQDGRQQIAEARRLSDLHYDLEMLTEPQAAAEDLMLSMRMTSGMGPGLRAHARNTIGAQDVDEALSWCTERGLARWYGASLVPTEDGWLLGNELYGRLWELSPGEVCTLSP